MVDLTADSDFESDDEATTATRIPAVTAKTPLPPLPRASHASHVSMGNSLSSSSGSRLAIDPAPPTRTEAARATTATDAVMKYRSATGPTTANMGRRASASMGNGQVHPATTATLNGNMGAERGAKRRKLSEKDGMPSAQNGVKVQVPAHSGGKQSNKGGATVSTPAQASPTVAASTSLRAKLNNANAAPSVSFMNTALKPSASSIPLLDDLSTPGARPLFIGRMSHADTATGLLTPGLTSPESLSAMAIDSDPVEPMEAEPPQPTISVSPGSSEPSNSRRGSFRDALEPTATSPASTLTNAVHAHSTLRHLSPLEAASTIENTEYDDGDSVIGDLPLRHSTPREIHQTPSFAGPDSRALSPASTPNQRRRGPTSSTRSAMEDHLIIFLKEVKKLKWTEITKEYLKHYPQSNYGRIQSRYSSVLNKRDRTQDPSTLDLPSRFAAEATIDWTSVHANTEPPRVRKEVVDLHNSSSSRSTHVEKPQRVPRAGQQARDNVDTSSGEFAPHRQRSRRAAPVNYTWPQLRTVQGGFEELPDAEESTAGTRTNFGAHSRLELPSDETPVITGSRNKTPRPKPLDPDLELRDAKLGLKLQGNPGSVQQERLPYLSSTQRLAMHEAPSEWMWDQTSIQDWQGAILHVDFSPAELQTVEKVVAKSIPSGHHTRHNTYRRHLRAVLKGLIEPKLQQLAYETSRHLRSRDILSIRYFLTDAATGKVSDVPQVQRLAWNKPNVSLSRTHMMSIPSHIRHRELGKRTTRGLPTASTPLTYQFKNQLMDSLGPKSTWTGASSDIHTVAWSPDGQYFAAGAVAVTDSDSMQYNRPNVLMYGDTINSSIHELGKHYIERPKTENGANSTHAMYVSQDPKLFTSVTSVAFSPSGRFMYSAGYDHSVCIWDTSARSQQPYMIRELQHKAPVDVLAVNPAFDGVIATGTKRTTDKSIKLVKFPEESIHEEPWPHTKANFASTRAISRPDLKMSANALKFDTTGQLLLAGFGANMREDNGFDTSGDICLWDVQSETALQLHGSSRNVFDVTFHPRPGYQGLFAVGCVANGMVNRGTRSVVRFYSPQKDYKFTCSFELECKALDMNDIVWW